MPKAERRRAIIVSDSADPYPRYNMSDEFAGWGSDKPGGSVVKFDERGELSRVKVVQNDSQKPPRLAVALDYFDIDIESVWAEGGIETAAFYCRQGSGHPKRKLSNLNLKPSRTGDKASFTYVLNVRAHKNLADAKVHFPRIVLHAPNKLPPLSLAIDPADARDGDFKVHLDLAQSRAFFRWIREAEEPDRFVAVFFDWSGNQAVSRHYDAAGPWIFEVAVGSLDAYDEVNQQYKIARPWRDVGGGDGSADWQDVPDFSWRQGFRTKTDELPISGMPTD